MMFDEDEKKKDGEEVEDVPADSVDELLEEEDDDEDDLIFGIEEPAEDRWE